MSALGQNQTYAMQKAMSALPRKRTYAAQQPMSALGQKQTSQALFDHLVGKFQERVADRQAKIPSRLKIDDEFELGW